MECIPNSISFFSIGKKLIQFRAVRSVVLRSYLDIEKVGICLSVYLYVYLYVYFCVYLSMPAFLYGKRNYLACFAKVILICIQ